VGKEMKIKTLLFDFDSTLVTIEGIDELARMKGKYQEVSQLTRLAMEGELAFEDVFYRRLEVIQPTGKDLDQLSELYQRSLVPDAITTIHRLREAGLDIGVVTGAYRQAIVSTAKILGIEPEKVWALELTTDEAGFLTRVIPNGLRPTTSGKRDFIISHNFRRQLVYVGDAMTDVYTREVADLFIGFGGVVERRRVRQLADNYVISLEEVGTIVLGINEEE